MKCRTKFFRGLVLKSGHSPYCAKCRHRRWKAAHPVSYHFNKLKYRAIERGHHFALSRDKFAELWNEGLRESHGKTKFSLCIDRKRNNEGYTDENVRLLTLSENSRRQYVPYFKNKADEEAAVRKIELELQQHPVSIEDAIR